MPESLFHFILRLLTRDALARFLHREKPGKPPGYYRSGSPARRTPARMAQVRDQMRRDALSKQARPLD